MKIYTFIIRSIAIALIIIGLGTIATITRAQSTPEFTPTLLVRGQTIIAEFTPEVNAHLYAFNGRANDLVTITMLQPERSSLDPYLIVMTGEGAVIASDDDGGPRVFSALIRDLRLPKDGTYFVLATTKEGERFDFEGIYGDARRIPNDLRYEISLSGTWVESEKLEFTATALRASSPLTIEITQSVHLGYATFTARKNDRVTLTTAKSGADMDTLLYLFDANGQRIAVNDDGDNMGYFSQIRAFTIPEDGIYFVIATSFGFQNAHEGNWDGIGKFTLTLN